MTNKHKKGPVKSNAQQTPCIDPRQDAIQTVPKKADKIVLGIATAMLLAWIAFLAVLAFGI